MSNLLTLDKSRSFANGTVYLLRTRDGYPVETTDTFLPYYTKDAIGRNQNKLSSTDLGSREERWMIGVSVMSGCHVGCKFCATGMLKKWRPLSHQEIWAQVQFVLDKYSFGTYWGAKEFKINYTRMGEPCLNLDNVLHSMALVEHWRAGRDIHHYVSTIGIAGQTYEWVEGNITLQISLHSLDEDRRKELIPFPRLASLEELGAIRTKSNLKTTLNLTLVDEQDFNIELLRKYFDPEHFFVKLSPINRNVISDLNELGGGYVQSANLL